MNKYFDNTDITFFKITFVVATVISMFTWYVL